MTAKPASARLRKTKVASQEFRGHRTRVMAIQPMKWLLVAPVAALAAATLSPHADRAAAEKFHRIVDEQLHPNEVLTFTEYEVNSFFAYEPPPGIPDGISNVRVRILEDRGVVDADVDLQRLQAAGGSEPSLLIRFLLRGERHVRAHVSFTSADGIGVADAESIDIDETTLRGWILDWLLEQYVTPRVPEFKPGEPFALPSNLKEIRLEEGQAVVEGF